MKGVVIINLKTYKFGKNLLKLVQRIEKVNKKIIVCCSAADVYAIKQNSSLTIFVQHIDHVIPGRNTGFITPESVKAWGASGLLINHSEHRLSFKEIKTTVKRCNDVGLKTCIFAKDLTEAKKIKKLKPTYLAIEPPELVASKTASISTSKPGLISNVASKLGYPFIVGAGVKSHQDFKIAIKLGAKGIILSSAVVKSNNPSKVLKKLIYG